MAEMDTFAVAARPLVCERLRAGEDVLVVSADGASLLDEAAQALDGECRVVRVTAGPGPLSLSGLLAQVAGTPDLTAHDDSVLEAGFHRLAVPDRPEGRIVLLISDAHTLQHPAMRFVQHVARTAPSLRLALAGGPALDAMLDEPDFASLRARLPAAIGQAVAPPAPELAEADVMPIAAEAAPGASDPAPGRERLATMSSRRGNSPMWAAAGLGLAASVALAAWAVRGPAIAPVTPQVAVAVQPQATPPLPTPALPSPALPTPAQPVRTAEPAAPVPEQPTRQAMLTPPSVPPPALPETQSGEAERNAVPTRPAIRSSELHRSDPAPRAVVRRAHVSRPGGRGAEPDHGYEWQDGPSQARLQPRWDRSEEGWGAPPPPPGPYIGTFARNGYGMRTFHYEEGW